MASHNDDGSLSESDIKSGDGDDVQSSHGESPRIGMDPGMTEHNNHYEEVYTPRSGDHSTLGTDMGKESHEDDVGNVESSRKMDTAASREGDPTSNVPESSGVQGSAERWVPQEDDQISASDVEGICGRARASASNISHRTENETTKIIERPAWSAPVHEMVPSSDTLGVENINLSQGRGEASTSVGDASGNEPCSQLEARFTGFHHHPSSSSSSDHVTMRLSSAIQALSPVPFGPSGTHLGAINDYVLPRWQPDVEVTICPICHTQFSFFVRKHHCRYGTFVFSLCDKPSAIQRLDLITNVRC